MAIRANPLPEVRPLTPGTESRNGIIITPEIDWAGAAPGEVYENPLSPPDNPVRQAVARLSEKYYNGVLPTDGTPQAHIFNSLLTREGATLAREIHQTQPVLSTDPGIHAPSKSRTLDTLDWGPVPPPLVYDTFLTPEGPTVLYAPGGTGKGVTSCWFALGLIREHGLRVLILDYEYHPNEWARRCRGLGYTDQELQMVEYHAPYSPEWPYEAGPLISIANDVRALVTDLDIGYLIVDSYSAATSSGDTMGGEAAAKEYFNALSRIGVPSLTIAHVTGSAERFPPKPFGSVHIRNLAREMWAMEAIEPPQGPYDPLTEYTQPEVIALELRCTKNNNGQHLTPQFISFSFHRDDSITAHRDQSTRLRTGEQGINVLSRVGKPLSAKDICSVIKAETGEIIKEQTMAKALQRSHEATTTSDVPKKWTLRQGRDAS